MEKASAKYLETYSETTGLDTGFLSKLEIKTHALVIPAYKETIEFIENLAQHPKSAQTLLICVVNEPQNDRNNRTNQHLVQTLEHRSNIRFRQEGLRVLQFGTLQILLILKLDIDALPDKQGVGLARKLGADIACLLHQEQKIVQPWVFSSDADATLPATHFDIAATPETSAICHPFRHAGFDSKVMKATLLYEKCLRYYRNQLLNAGSPYAFFTLGSVMTVSMKHYMQARGFPKRSGAEDFYLLNKLAKLGKIIEEGEEVLISARVSNRVPFGTGPAVKEIIDKLHRNEPIRYYSPHTFHALKQFIETIPDIWEAPNCRLEQLLPNTTALVLKEASFEQFLNKRRSQDKTLSQFLNSFHEWFDAFQTLKFIRRMRQFWTDVDIEALCPELFYN